MIRNTIIVIVCLTIFAALGAGYFFGYDHGFEKAVQQSDSISTENFHETGKLVRVSGQWHIEYVEHEENGAIKNERLGFELDAICSNQQGNTDRPPLGYCGSYELRPNDVIEVRGERMKDYIRVTRLIIAQGSSKPNSLDPYRMTEEYGDYGTLTLTGYLETEHRICNPGDMCGETVDYAFFVFTDTDNEYIKQVAGPGRNYEGNAFFGQSKVGIGCVMENKIVYSNDADIGNKNGEIIGSDYTKLIRSTKNNQVQLKMTKEIYTSGRGAPDCYSHFRNFDVL